MTFTFPVNHRIPTRMSKASSKWDYPVSSITGLLEVVIQTIDELVDTDFVPKVGLVSIPMPLGRDEHPVDDLNHAVLSDDILH
jgi:hypothetical protein